MKRSRNGAVVATESDQREEETRDIREFITRLLKGETATWPQAWNSARQAAFLQACAREGVSQLVYRQLRQNAKWDEWPSALKDRFKALSVGEGFRQPMVDFEVDKICQALSRYGLSPLIFKGAALAHTHYADPVLRPRCDTDLLISRKDETAMTSVFADLGYQQEPANTGDLIMYQWSFARSFDNGFRHVCDVHWKLSNAQLFSELFSFEELKSRSIPLPAAGSYGRAFSNVDSLLVACMHRVAHHRNSERLIWLMDIHLLVESLSPEEEEQFVGLCVAKNLAAVGRDGVEKTHQQIPTRHAERLISALENGMQPGHEATAEFLHRPGQRWVLISDLRAILGWSQKLRLLREHLFPSPDFMYQRYNTRSRPALPFLYADRLLRAAWRLLQPSRR